MKREGGCRGYNLVHSQTVNVLFVGPLPNTGGDQYHLLHKTTEKNTIPQKFLLSADEELRWDIDQNWNHIFRWFLSTKITWLSAYPPPIIQRTLYTQDFKLLPVEGRNGVLVWEIIDRGYVFIETHLTWKIIAIMDFWIKYFIWLNKDGNSII